MASIVLSQLYADDIVLLLDSLDELQTILDCLHKLSISWKIYTNANESETVHFQKF